MSTHDHDAMLDLTLEAAHSLLSTWRAAGLDLVAVSAWDGAADDWWTQETGRLSASRCEHLAARPQVSLGCAVRNGSLRCLPCVKAHGWPALVEADLTCKWCGLPPGSGPFRERVLLRASTFLVALLHDECVFELRGGGGVG